MVQPTRPGTSEQAGDASVAPAPAAAGPDRPRRADARQNRARILAAAREAFATEGSDAQMGPIARRAGVGVGTLYRNFPTKEALITELARVWTVERADDALRALRLGDPWQALTAYVESHAWAVRDSAGLQAIFDEVQSREAASDEGRRLAAALSELLGRARTAGVLREDIVLGDFQALLCGVSAAIAHGGDPRRCATVLLDGMRRATA
ncbi:TetR/AcrR family transcriptional regulator [Sphaerisporangium sp. NPDC051017]|uniref:TetR/AcrR family transcriptional regulator n=1 Tax=unclassified Sphaerisporangium TaxID=2630420 RepID=UPI0033CC1BF2